MTAHHDLKNSYGIVPDACGGLTNAVGARKTSWVQVLLELQRDCTRHETYDGAHSIVRRAEAATALRSPIRAT